MSDRFKILLVDDSVSDEKDFKRILSLIGIFDQVDWTKDPNEALERCQNYDLIVLDVYLDNQNGLDFISKFRSRSKAAIFIYTGSAEEMKKDAFSRGAEWVLQKPLDPLNFVSAILSLKIGRFKLIRQLGET